MKFQAKLILAALLVATTAGLINVQPSEAQRFYSRTYVDPWAPGYNGNFHNRYWRERRDMYRVYPRNDFRRDWRWRRWHRMHDWD